MDHTTACCTSGCDRCMDLFEYYCSFYFILSLLIWTWLNTTACCASCYHLWHGPVWSVPRVIFHVIIDDMDLFERYRVLYFRLSLITYTCLNTTTCYISGYHWYYRPVWTLPRVIFQVIIVDMFRLSLMTWTCLNTTTCCISGYHRWHGPVWILPHVVFQVIIDDMDLFEHYHVFYFRLSLMTWTCLNTTTSCISGYHRWHGPVWILPNVVL